MEIIPITNPKKVIITKECVARESLIKRAKEVKTPKDKYE